MFARVLADLLPSPSLPRRGLACLGRRSSAATTWAESTAEPNSRMSAQDFIRRSSAKESAIRQGAWPTSATRSSIGRDPARRHGGRRVPPGLGRRASTPAAPERETIAGAVNTLKRIKFADRDIDALRDAFALTPDRVADRRHRLFRPPEASARSMPRCSTSCRATRRPTCAASRAAPGCGRATTSIDAGPAAAAQLRRSRRCASRWCARWSPSSTGSRCSIRADEDAPDRQGQPVHVRVTVKYSDYKAR